MTQFTPNDQFRQLPSGLSGIFGLGGGPRGDLWPPRPRVPHIQQPFNQDPYGIKPMGEQITGFGETFGGYGEQLGGFESTLGGFGEQMGGYGEQLGGFESALGGIGEQMGGFGNQFNKLNEKLSSMEQGIASLTEKFGTTQQQNQPQQNYNPYASLFGGGMFSPFGGLGGLFGRY